MNIKVRLIIMNFLQFAVWGAYLTSMGNYLQSVGMGDRIGLFYAMQGIVSLFMPAITGVIADRWVPAQRLYGICHALASIFIAGAALYGFISGNGVEFGTLFLLYSLSVAFYMPTLALANSVAYSSLEQSGLDTIKTFPPIRIFGTIGFICSMLLVDILGFQSNVGQFLVCASAGAMLFLYSFTLPRCAVGSDAGSGSGSRKSLVESMGLRAFLLFKKPKMAIF